MDKCLSFIEWVIQNGFVKTYGVDIYPIRKNVLDFYNQPFTTDMLVNPTPPYTNKPFEVYKEEFAQAEQKRLFEGWEKSEFGYYNSSAKICMPDEYLRGLCEYTIDEVKTILKREHKIELQWNPNNIIIKNLNLN